MLVFICIGSAELFGPGRERKIQNEKYVSSGIRTHAARPQWLDIKLSCIVLQYPDL